MSFQKIDYNNYKVFVFDLDYTLYLHEHHTNSYNDKIVELLSLLKNNDKILCIATHNRCPEGYLKDMNIINFFDDIVHETKILSPFYNSIREYTCKKEMLQNLMKKYNYNSEDIVFFDDSLYNINKVKSLGIKTIQISPNLGINTDELFYQLKLHPKTLKI